ERNHAGTYLDHCILRHSNDQLSDSSTTTQSPESIIDLRDGIEHDNPLFERNNTLGDLLHDIAQQLLDQFRVLVNDQSQVDRSVGNVLIEGKHFQACISLDFTLSEFYELTEWRNTLKA